MPLDQIRLYDDNFIFESTENSKKPVATLDSQTALEQSLVARGVDTDALTEDQIGTLTNSAAWLDTAMSADLTTGQDAVALLGSELDITLVEDFRTTDGQKLNGAATEDGRIYLDANLREETLVDTLVEEIAEAAFYSAFDRASQGDFGAEVVARMSKAEDLPSLGRFVNPVEDDIVQTEFGAAQAAVQPSDFMTGPFGSDLIKANGLIGLTDVTTKNGVLENLNNTPLVTPKASDFDLESVQGKYDLNLDGVLDEYKMKAVYLARDVSVLEVTPTRLIPTSESKTVLIGKGEASTTWVLREEESHSTDVQFGFSSSVALELSASGEFLGIGASSSLTTTVETNESVTTSNSFTVANEVRDSYTIPAGAYEEGILVNYGFHMIVADVSVVEETQYLLEITNSENGQDHVDFRAQDTGVVKDHYAGLVVTDYDVTDAPNGDEILGFV
ncbi:hypothetical protein [uncultured Tateyamaria sp.]|uniref:hypothetical protein n=1 Tax=uncultured Tateyamaria sp. TaxID=455651 RepID=UPI002631825B|nr:hypothetical protein [uncultured Tateyamaria sp.]